MECEHKPVPTVQQVQAAFAVPTYNISVKPNYHKVFVLVASRDEVSTIEQIGAINIDTGSGPVAYSVVEAWSNFDHNYALVFNNIPRQLAKAGIVFQLNGFLTAAAKIKGAPPIIGRAANAIVQRGPDGRSFGCALVVFDNKDAPSLLAIPQFHSRFRFAVGAYSSAPVVATLTDFFDEKKARNGNTHSHNTIKHLLTTMQVLPNL